MTTTVDGPVIVIDTREQLPYTFRRWSPVLYFDTLQTGDYSIDGYRDYVVAERKSLSDFYGSIGKRHECFFREMARLACIRHRLLIVESSMQSTLDTKSHRFTRLNRNQVISNIVSIVARYGVPVLFADTRNIGEEFIWEFLIKTYDILTSDVGCPLAPALFLGEPVKCSLCGLSWRDAIVTYPGKAQRDFYRTALYLDKNNTALHVLGKLFFVCLECRAKIRKGDARLPEGLVWANALVRTKADHSPNS